LQRESGNRGQAFEGNRGQAFEVNYGGFPISTKNFPSTENKSSQISLILGSIHPKITKLIQDALKIDTAHHHG